MGDEHIVEQSRSDVAILVVSCDIYRDLWYPFFYCFFKYWPDCPYPIYLGSNFTRYLDSRVQPILIGPDVDYTSNLIAMINHINQQWIILWIEDRVLSAPVDTARVANLIRLVQNQQGGHLKLIANHPFALVADPTQEIGEIPKGTRYRVCMTVVLWRKEVLLKILRPGETAWQFERQGSKRSNDLDEKFFCLTWWTKRNPPISHQHLIIRGRLSLDTRRFLKQEGLLDGLRKRPLQTMASYWSLKARIAVADLSVQLKSWFLSAVSGKG